MVKYFPDKEMKEKIRQLIKTDIDNKMPARGQIGNNVKIINTKEITNCVINDYCEVNGASRLSDCTLLGSVHGNVYIGTGVITVNSIIAEGASVINSVKIQDCFVGEACQLSNGFTASASVFFANSYMSNGGRLAQRSAVLSPLLIIRAVCLSEACSLSITPVLPPTSATMPNKARDPCTGAFWSAVPRQPAVLIS